MAEQEQDSTAPTAGLPTTTANQETDRRRASFTHIPKGSGGTYTFTRETTPYIGTSGCGTSLGVYFAIDDTRCFAAHIDINVITSEAGHKSRTMFDEGYSDKVMAEVAHRLDLEQWVAQWGPPTDRMRDSLVLVCPNVFIGDFPMRFPLVGAAVCVAIQEWLQFEHARTPEKVDGFVVQHPAGMPQYLSGDAMDAAWQKEDEADEQSGVWDIEVRHVEAALGS
ncbi:hypothetical protein LTR08_003214 [Meristemomyces frigidus]|nr:hypothetical protein LTR08_003214 [Meristemomyces frigidus]